MTGPKSHMLSIRDEEENNFVLEQLLRLHYMASWVLLGLTYEGESDIASVFCLYSNFLLTSYQVTKVYFFKGYVCQ